MKSQALNVFKFLIGWPLSILALLFIIRLVLPQISEIQSAITSVDIGVLGVSLVCFIGYYISRTYLWHEMVKRKGIEISLKETMHLWSLSEINRYVPGNIWSIISRSAKFGEKKLSKKDVATSLLHETMFVLLAAVIVSTLSLPYLKEISFTKQFFDVVKPEYIVLCVSLLTVLFVFQQKVVKRVFPRLSEKPIIIQETPQVTLKFLFIALCGMMSFGFGYFFALSSVVSIPINDFFTLSGFAVVALLVGFASFITPTGLGVREGFLTLGLTLFMSVSLAGFASLFARLVLIFAEVLFLFGTSLLFKSKNNFVLRCEKYVATHVTEVFLVIAVTIYTLYFSVASFLRFDNFYTGRFDLGNMVQTVWNTSEGRIFLFSHPDSTETVSRLAFHADFILVFFAPWYYVWNHPDLLLFIQSLVVGCGAFFLYGIARHLLKNKTLSFIIAVSYLLNPALERANLYDFHAVVLATTFFLAVWYFFLKKKYVWMAVFLILAGITKEQVWAITSLFGLLIIGREFLRYKKEKISYSLLFVSNKFLFGLSVFVLSLLLFYLLIWHFIPQAMGGEHFAVEFYGELGSSPSDIVTSILFDPFNTFRVIGEPERVSYLKQLFLPVGYLPLLFPFVLIFALPDFLINLLSSNANLHQIYYQYTATITPFLFIAMVYSVWWIHKAIPKVPLFVFSLYILVTAFYGAYLYGPLPGGKRPNTAMFDKKTENREEISEFLSRIPPTLSVAATNNAGSHLSERKQIYTIPVGMDEADVLVFLVDPNPSKDKELKEKIVWYMNNPNYILLKKLNNFYVFQKNVYLTYF